VAEAPAQIETGKADAVTVGMVKRHELLVIDPHGLLTIHL
jgi:hypothetical protein